MAEGSLIGKLDSALNHLRVIEREKNEAVARAAVLEQEIKELRGLISMAESKAEEILRGMPMGSGIEVSGHVLPAARQRSPAG